MLFDLFTYKPCKGVDKPLRKKLKCMSTFYKLEPYGKDKNILVEVFTGDVITYIDNLKDLVRTRDPEFVKRVYESNYSEMKLKHWFKSQDGEWFDDDTYLMYRKELFKSMLNLYDMYMDIINDKDLSVKKFRRTLQPYITNMETIVDMFAI
jgi:hypothetical protein